MADSVGVIARGHVAVVTGGASGIGLATAEALLERGMKVVLADIDEPKLRDVEARLTESGAEVAGVICNTSDEAAVEALAEATLERFGAAHLVFNNAGIYGFGDAWAGDISLWRRVVDVNLFGVVHGIRSFLPIMTEQGVGHIVNTASMAGLLAMPGAAPYNATKHAVVALSEGLYLELAATDSPVSVSVLCPGFVKTDLMEKEVVTGADAAGPVSGQMASLMGQLIADGVETGIAASDAADAVVDAVDARRFWILTDDEMAQRAVERTRRAASQTNPPLTGAD